MTGRPLLDPTAVPEDIRPVSVALVGAYVIQLRWSDGHGTGIFSFDRLWAAGCRRGRPEHGGWLWCRNTTRCNIPGLGK